MGAMEAEEGDAAAEAEVMDAEAARAVAAAARVVAASSLQWVRAAAAPVGRMVGEEVRLVVIR